ncbi:MAG TPA: hypothetical protein VHE61_24020 [Opitutaceae bacterium]|nr:hypothetical protein [Opitutaceae bacterium]
MLYSMAHFVGFHSDFVVTTEPKVEPRVWHGRVDTDTWQNGHLAGESLDELKFWMRTSG